MIAGIHHIVCRTGVDAVLSVPPVLDMFCMSGEETFLTVTSQEVTTYCVALN